MNNLANQPLICPIMVGRDLYLDSLIALFERARGGQGQIALVSGEAGIGKSRLIRELKARLEGVRVLQSNCYELDQTQPYAPFAEMLPDLTVSSADQPGTLTRFFRQAGQVLFIMEDIQWCDDASLEYLIYLAQHLGDQPVLLVLTWRSDTQTSALMRFLAAIDRTRLVTEFQLAPLSLSDVDMMLRVIFERPARADFLETLHALTEGNPFFTEEILRSAGENLLTQLPIPRTVQAAVQQRTDGLSQAARRVLIQAAVIGRRFDFAMLQNLTGQNEADLLQSLRELIGAQLVVEESPDIFAFRHALTRQAVYTSLLARERRALHQVVARVYLEKQADHLLSDLAYHCYQGELWEQAMNFSMQAGQRAQMLHSPAAALEHYTNALLSARRLSVTPPVSLHQARGKMYEMLGEFEAARGDYEQALEAARKTGRVHDEARGLLDLGFLWTARSYEKAGAYFRQASALARGSDDSAMLADTLNRIGLWQTHAEQPLEALRHYQEALATYRSIAHIDGIGETLDLLGVTAFMAGDLKQGWHYFDEAIALCREMDNRPQLANYLLTSAIRGGALLVDTLVWIPTSHSACIAQCEEAIQIARDLHLPATEAYARIMLAHILGWQGEFGRALVEADTALKISQEIEHRMWSVNACVILGALHLELLDFSTAQTHLEQALANSEGLHSLYMQYLVSSVLSRVYIAQARLPEAEGLLHAIISPDLPMQTLAQRLIWTAQADYLMAAEVHADALEIIERLSATAANRDEMTVIPRLWFLRGRALKNLKRAAEAEAALEGGFEAARRWGNRALAWRIGIELGNLYMAQKDDAQEIFDEVRNMINAIAAAIPDRATRENFYIHAFQQMPHTQRKASKRPTDGLTPREREVAALVAEGKTNHAIADQLILSERTIEKHVENIMSKLGFNARSQIAAWAIQKK